MFGEVFYYGVVSGDFEQKKVMALYRHCTPSFPKQFLKHKQNAYVSVMTMLCVQSRHFWAVGWFTLQVVQDQPSVISVVRNVRNHIYHGSFVKCNLIFQFCEHSLVHSVAINYIYRRGTLISQPCFIKRVITCVFSLPRFRHNSCKRSFESHVACVVLYNVQHSYEAFGQVLVRFIPVIPLSFWRHWR